MPPVLTRVVFFDLSSPGTGVLSHPQFTGEETEAHTCEQVHCSQEHRGQMAEPRANARHFTQLHFLVLQKQEAVYWTLPLKGTGKPPSWLDG